MDSSWIYAGAVLFLLAGSIVPYIYNHKRIRQLSLFFTLLGSIFLIYFSGKVLYAKQTLQWQISSGLFSLPASIDSLAAFFILLIAIISLCVGIYSFSYQEHLDSRKDIFISLMNLFILSLVLVVSSSSLLAFLFFWEFMSITSFLLVMSEYKKEETQKAGIFYFVMTQFSTVFILIAFILIYHYTGTLKIENLTDIPSSLANTIFLLLFVAFGTKAGIIPFHKWLPYAHPASPSPISALMSGVMIKVAIYGIIRFLFLFPEQKLWWGIFILIFGTISALLGVIYALKEHDLKRLLAYHSIENIGIIVMGIGLYIIFQQFALEKIAALSLAAALFHTLNHALFKSLLFLSAGSVVYSTHSKNIEEMGGLIKKMPYTAILFLIGAISISALPPFNGFVSELMLFQAFFQSGSINLPLVKIILFLSLSLLALTSALAAACFVKAFGMVFLALPRSREAELAKEVPKTMIIGPAILALLCMGLGIFSYQIFAFIGRDIKYNFPLPNLLWITLLMTLLTMVVVFIVHMCSSRRSRVSETWSCGIHSQNSKMEYTASGFSEPLLTIFASIYRPKKINERTYFDSAKVIFKEGFAEVKVLKFFEEFFYLPIVKALQRISAGLYMLQNKVELDSYMLYCFITILLLVIITSVVRT